MIKLIKRLLGFREPDELIKLLSGGAIFKSVGVLDRLLFPNTDSGMTKVGVFRSYIKESESGLYLLLAVYRGTATPYQYKFKWFYCDEDTDQPLFSLTYKSPKLFGINELQKQFIYISNASKAMKATHNYYKVYSSSRSKININDLVVGLRSNTDPEAAVTELTKKQ